MSYEALEASTDGGKPVELYRFARSANVWTYTSADAAQTLNAETYQPITISRSGIDHGPELNKSAIKVSVPRDNEVAGLFRIAPPAGVVSLTVFRHHRGDNEFVSYWKGRVLAAAWSGSTATLSCEPLTSSFRRSGLRPRFQAMCRHVHYDAGCRVEPELFRTDGTIILIDGATISAEAWGTQPDGYFTAGFAFFGDGERRLIRSHTGQALTLSAPLPGLALGDVVRAYAGCDHTLATCEHKFANHLNFGGFPNVPTKNPFGPEGAK